jgi:hypothetical protein
VPLGIDNADLHTETFSNSQGWTVVRVTHVPTALVIERPRSARLQSAVQAQKECIEEIADILAEDKPPPAEEPAPAAQPRRGVSRTEFEALAERVARLEERIAPDE